MAHEAAARAWRFPKNINPGVRNRTPGLILHQKIAMWLSTAFAGPV